MAQMTPEEFARGTQQAFGKAPTQPKPVKSDTPPPSEQWIKRIAEAYPPYREMRTVPVGNPERGQPTTRTYMVSPEIDPFVIGFLTDVLGPMVSIDTADRLHRGDVSGHYGRHGEISDRVRAAYGSWYASGRRMTSRGRWCSSATISRLTATSVPRTPICTS